MYSGRMLDSRDISPLLLEAIDAYKRASRVLLDASKETENDPEKQRLVKPLEVMFKAMQERELSYKIEIAKPGKINKDFAIAEMLGLANDMLGIAFQMKKLLGTLN